MQELLLADGDVVRFGPSQEPGLPELSFHRQPPPRLGLVARGLSLGLAAIAAGGLGLLALSLLQVPLRNRLASVRGPLALYDGANRPLSSAESSLHHENPGLRDYPGVLIDALLASEDSRFWWHPGIDPIGTGRALVANLVGGRVLEGAAPSPSNWPAASIPKPWARARPWSASGGSCSWRCNWSSASASATCCSITSTGCTWGGLGL